MKTFRYWDVVLGQHAMRISAHNDRGDEYYAIITMEGSRLERKARKDEAIDAIHAAMTSGRDPGAVPLTAEEVAA